MAKHRNTFAKRTREADKKRKAIDKVERRRHRKDQPEQEPVALPQAPQPLMPRHP